MKISKKMLLLPALAVCALCANAQEAAEEYEYVFQPFWYGQIQGGVQETLGETSFGKLISPNFQIAAGYQWNPIFGARLAVNAYQSKGAFKMEDPFEKYNWKWKYVAPTVDLTMDLTNAIGGFNPERCWSIGAFLGVGANIAFDNKEANSVNAELTNRYNPGGEPVLRNIWDGTKCRFVGQGGLTFDVRVAQNWQVGLELQANVLSDKYNSKRAGNADWYFNGLVGVKYTFGDWFTKKAKPAPVCAEPQIVEKIVEKVVEVPAPVAVPADKYVEHFQRDIFFTINKYNVTIYEMTKIEQVAQFLERNPEAKIRITGYADKGTGSMALNLRLSKERAQAVADILVKKFNINPGRLIVESMGEAMHQPYNEPVLNRVAICVAE